MANSSFPKIGGFAEGVGPLGKRESVFWGGTSNPKQPVFMDGNGETPMFHVMIWFIIQLKQPFKTGCLEFQA